MTRSEDEYRPGTPPRGEDAEGPWCRVSVPDAVQSIPAMLSSEEKQYLVWLTAERFRGEGHVVDLGPWLGCSTAALAEGLSRSGRQGSVWSLDRFAWNAYMERNCAAELPEGADFLHLHRRHTEPYADRIRTRRIDLHDAVWNDGPIEILFVDAAKSWELTNAILRTFGTALIPGLSSVVLQDFKFPHTFWLPLIFESRPDLWERVHSVRNGCSVTYRLRTRLDQPAGAGASYSPEDFSLDAVRATYRGLLGDRATGWLGLSYYRALLTYGRGDLAAEVLGEVRAGGWTPPDQLERRVEQARAVATTDVIQAAWRSLRTGDLDHAERLVRAEGLAPRPERWLVRGHVEQRRGHHDRAIEMFDRAIESQTFSSPEPRLSRARSALPSSRYHGVNSDVLTALLESSPPTRDQVAAGVRILFDCWMAQRDPVVARSGCARLLGRFPDHADVHMLAAVVDREMGDVPGAATRLRRALALDPEHEQARRMLDQLSG